VVTGEGVPPPIDEIRKRGEPAVGVYRITFSVLQLPGCALRLSCASTMGAFPLVSILCSLLSATNARSRLSGDQNSICARSVPGRGRAMSSSSGRMYTSLLPFASRPM
jgi:hypothetical protein